MVHTIRTFVTMRKTFALLFCLGLSSLGYAQQAFSIHPQWEVADQGVTLTNPWTGGLNSPQFSPIDLNYDGNMDLVAFDRITDQMLCFVQENNQWFYKPELSQNFPYLEDWVLARDFDGDGKADLFCSTSAGIKVYKNVGNSATGPVFEYYLDTTKLFSDYGSGTLINLYVSRVDIPAIVDVDKDGDLDIITFALAGTTVEFHKNLSMETYGHSDSLIFRLETDCWGLFEEDFITNDISLEACPGRRAKPIHGKPKHSGSTLTVFDVDGNQLPDVLLGDVSFNTIVAAFNTGSISSARMTSKDTLFPFNDTPVQMPIFPAAYQLDVDFDGVLDLVVTPSTSSGGLNHDNIWWYKNTGSNSSPNFQFQSKDFLMKQSLDFGDQAIPELVDLNGDGLMDLVIGSYGIYDGAGNYQSALWYIENTGNTSQPAFDIVNKDLGGFTGNEVLPAQHPCFGDMDDDGDLDMFLGDRDGKIHYYKNIGDKFSPQFVLNQVNYLGIDVGNFSAPTLVDLDRNGTLDLVIGERSGNLNYYENVGTKTDMDFTFITDSLGGVDVSDPIFLEGHADPIFVEINGYYELYVGNTFGKVFKYTNIDGNLSGDFQLETDQAIPSMGGKRLGVALGQLDSDVYLEAIIGNLNGGLYAFDGVDSSELGLATIQEIDWKIYPNPSTGPLVFESAFRGLIRVYDVEGRVITQAIKNTEKFQFDGSYLPPGVYFISGKNGQQVFTAKWIKLP